MAWQIAVDFAHHTQTQRHLLVNSESREKAKEEVLGHQCIQARNHDFHNHHQKDFHALPFKT